MKALDKIIILINEKIVELAGINLKSFPLLTQGSSLTAFMFCHRQTLPLSFLFQPKTNDKSLIYLHKVHSCSVIQSDKQR